MMKLLKRMITLYQKAGNDEQNVPNGWTVKDGGVGGEICILFEKVEKSRKILQNLSKTFLSDQLRSYSLIIFNRPTYQLKFYF